MEHATPAATAGHASTSQASALPDLLPLVRRSVRALLLSSPAYRALSQADRDKLARAMVRVCHTAAALIHEELESSSAVQRNKQAAAAAEALAAPMAASVSRRPLARTQGAGDAFSGVAAARVAGTTQAILNAVSFPRFVTDLINGIFKAMVDTNVQQMNSYVELLNNVAASVDGFADSNLGPDRARAWLVEKYPGSFELDQDSGDEGDDDQPGAPPQSTLRLKPGASMPSPEALKTDLGLGDDETIPSGDPETTLVPFARRKLAKTRQEMLATMVMLGMQRIVIDSGRITASMRFHIDTRSAAQEDKGNRFDLKNTITGSGSFGFGPWGASASISNTIGYVSTQKTQTTEEMNTDLDLNSSVEINFKSDYLPLNRLASSDQVSRIRQNTRNPEAEAEKAAQDARAARAAQAGKSDEQRRASLDRSLTPAPDAAPPGPARHASPGQDQKGAAPSDNSSGVGAEGAKPRDAKGARGSTAKPAPPARSGSQNGKAVT
jgi:hypothetical protein